ncbi:hypothetical protein ZYGM_001567 [Zygosaccharomyces mellis]|uniref:Uncharacterized protein n=1 Tax=Zygosaccharomyces mellis TaxID=42258 RepID=A0A4C2E491_9SACH|nr:hypothetical protein ZYGM_001567 [Zygosaccharomyces mellis]
MPGKKRNSNSSRLKLVAPRRGLQRSRSVFNERRGPRAANNDTRYKVHKTLRADISQDTGHALDWLDSLIRKGRGILDSLEEEESLFKRELGGEKRRTRIQEQLIENALDGDSETELEKENSGIDTSSFRCLAENVRNTLTEYNNNNENEDDSSDGPCGVEEVQYEEDKPKADVEQEDIVILSDEDEERPQESEKSEGGEAGQILSDEQEIDLISSDQNLNDREAEEDKNDEDETFERQYFEKQKLRTTSEDAQELEDEQAENRLGANNDPEERAVEIVGDLTGGFLPTSSQVFDEKLQDGLDIDTQTLSADETSYYDTNGQEEAVGKKNVCESLRNAVTEDEDGPEFSKSTPDRYDEVVLFDGDQLEKQKLEEQEVSEELQDQEREQEMEQPKVEKILESEQKREGEEGDNQEKEQDQEAYLGRQERGFQQDQETRKSEGYNEEGRWEQYKRAKQMGNPEERSVEVNTSAANQVPDYLYDYQMIANQAIHQLLQTANEQPLSSESTSSESFSDTKYGTPEGYVFVEEDGIGKQDMNRVAYDVNKVIKPSASLHDNEDKERNTSEIVNATKKEIKSTNQHNDGSNINKISKNSLLQQSFKPDPKVEDADSFVSSLEDDSTIYYSTDEHLVAEEPLHQGVEDESVLAVRRNKEFDIAPSRYEILFCESDYSSSSNEDNARVVEPVGAYVSPFTENPFSNTQRLEDPEAFLRRTLESLGESFGSESEDVIMEDANDFDSSSNEDFFSQASDANNVSDAETVKGLKLSDNMNNFGSSSEVVLTDTCNQIGNTQSPGDDSIRPLQFFSNTDFPLFISSEPDLIEEVDSERIPQDQEKLILEEVGLDEGQARTVCVESEPIIEFDSEPQDFADIILDEFTAPDLVEEASDTEDGKNDISLEEVSEFSTTETVHVITTEPIVEHPEPLPFANVEVLELAESDGENTDNVMVDVGSSSFKETNDFHLHTGRGFNTDVLSGNFNGESLESTSLEERTGESSKQRPRSIASRLFSSPIRVLRNVISGVKDVGNVLTDFVNTVDMNSAETDTDVENSSPGVPRADFRSESEAEVEFGPQTNVLGFNISDEDKSLGDKLDNREILSGVQAIQRLAWEFENRPISSFRERSPSIDDNDAEEEFNTSVKKDTNSELEVGEEDSFLENDQDRFLSKGSSVSKRKKEDNENNETKDDIKVENTDPGGMEEKSMEDVTSDEGIRGAQETELKLGGQEDFRKQSNDSIERENSGNKYENTGNYGHEEIKSKKNSFPVSTKPMELKYSYKAPLRNEEANEEKPETDLQIKGVQVEDENEDAIQVPVKIEDEEPKSLSKEQDLQKEKDSEPAQYGSKKKRGKKRKHSSPISESSKRRGPGSSKSQDKRKKGPITRSRTTPSPSERNTRRNTRSKRTR